MSNLQKSSLTVNGNTMHMSVPFAKVDKAQRLVSGYATLDNVDSQGDIVTAEASKKAFARARGNIREMHQPIAVGRMVDFREDEFFHEDPVTGEGKFYRGIFVTARVSEGAQDTWTKVLDGTLTGFSIGGEILEATPEFNKEANKSVRIIKDYDLVELSLVDNPANQLANVLSIQKSDTGSVMLKGMAVETVVENVFVCTTDKTVVSKDAETADCPMCGQRMDTAGWFESGADRAEKTRDIVDTYLKKSKEAAPESTSEGGVEVGKKDKEEAPVVETDAAETPAAEETPAEEPAVDVEETDEEEETAEAPEEVHDDAAEISKKIDELHEAVKESLEKSHTETSTRLEKLEKRVDDATSQFLEKTSELDAKFAEFGEKLETSKSRLADLESRLEKINSAAAFRKSGDVESPVQEQKRTFWGGAFSN